MPISDLVQILNTAVLVFGVALIALFFGRWQRARDHERRLQLEMELTSKDPTSKPELGTAKQPEGMGAGGYIVLNLPDDQKPLFHDVLKGFEEYAMIKGYEIRFSIDNSMEDKIAFKFTVGRAGISVSTQRVESDLHEYIEKVQKGDALDDMPIVVSEPQHHALVMAMRNRINFLQHTYTAQRNVLQYYEEVMKVVRSEAHGFVPAHNFYIQGGGTMSAKTFTAVASQNVAQGDGNNLANNTADQCVHIGMSFSERKVQLEAVEQLVSVLKAQLELNDHSSRALISLEKIRDELEHEEKPDGSRIQRWLETVRDTLSTAALTKEVIDATKSMFEIFGVPAF